MVGWLTNSIFFIATLIFFFYSFNYHYFRHNQKFDCLHIYKEIPPILVQKARNYYQQLYTEHFLNIKKNNEI